MQTSINLQEPFTYGIWPLLIIILLIVVVTNFAAHTKKRIAKPRIKEKEVKVIPEKNIKNIPAIKNKYLKQLQFIEQKYTNNEISSRKAYQLISEKIRLFIFEVTDITTQNYTLAEIKKLDMPVLYEVIEEYYEPEFASKSIGDFEASINKARRVIEKWN